jgi:hypothetical protein
MAGRVDPFLQRAGHERGADEDPNDRTGKLTSPHA